MREAMANAPVGDDVFGEDPTVNLLQAKVAEMLGKPAALYVPSGSMGNQICIKVHTKPGDEIIAERGAHIFNYETGAIAFLSGAQTNLIDGESGVMTAEQVKRAIRPRVYYMSRTSLICLENTHNRAGGTIYPLETIKSITNVAREEGIRMHLDGARLWNACVETGVSPREYASHFDSVSVCMSKGLGAPVGSVIAGTPEFIADARRYRKIFGGGMRQAGVIAAACLYAIENNIARLKEDHRKAKHIATDLSRMKGLAIHPQGVQTNILIIGLEKTGKTPEQVLLMLKERGVLLTPGNYMSVRAVTHMDVSMDDLKRAASIIGEVFR